MGYPCPVFNASELPDKIQADLKGRKRKLEGRARHVDLAACALHEMLQYKCEIQEPEKPESPVRCYAVERLFRQCRDRKGTFMVETTAWERDKSPAANNNAKDKEPHPPFQWSLSWHNADEAP